MLKKARKGGHFDIYPGPTRDVSSFREKDVALLKGFAPGGGIKGVERLDFEEGTLSLFRGSQVLHRV